MPQCLNNFATRGHGVKAADGTAQRLGLDAGWSMLGYLPGMKARAA
jgi:hypothetical protein